MLSFSRTHAYLRYQRDVGQSGLMTRTFEHTSIGCVDVEIPHFGIQILLCQYAIALLCTYIYFLNGLQFYDIDFAIPHPGFNC